MDSSEKLTTFYQTLLEHFGPQGWWPGDTPFEIMVGAVLTQNTNWTNVEKAITNLKKAQALEPEIIDQMPPAQLAELIRPAGYYNVKTKRLKNLVKWFCQEYQGTAQNIENLSVQRLREELLAINGIGFETADSIVLYAFEKPTFVIDAYTCRIFSRHGCLDQEMGYEEIKDFFEWNLPQDIDLYKEYHALIVRLGKEFCRPKPRCENCPLRKFDHDNQN